MTHLRLVYDTAAVMAGSLCLRETTPHEPCEQPWGHDGDCGDLDAAIRRHPAGKGEEGMTDLPPYSRKPITLPDGTPVIGWSGPTTPTRPQRCACGRPVPASSLDGIHCAEHDSPIGDLA